MVFRSNETAFKYVISELVDNVYQHSEFNYVYVMAQKYQYKGFIELGFLDDGITIPGNFKGMDSPIAKVNTFKR